MAIAIRKPQEIEKIKIPAKLVAKTLRLLKENTKPGITPIELDKMAEEFIRDNGGRPAFKGLYDFPNSVCISRNGVVIHGIPTNEPLKEGEVVGFDVGVEIDGWYGDAAITIGVGKIKDEYQKMIDVSREALYHAIENIKPGMRYKQISKLIEDYITSHGFVPLKGYSGHGIGRKPHEEPQILNYVEGKANQGEKVKNGHVFCLEPMLCHKCGEPVLADNGWDVYCEDMEVGVHYEHQVAVINNKAIILTQED
ncbi:methionine aminopeptidase, type I [Nautilia profundicola AmH]|uniref:Methionine aminopeptidase n=1 Tax=Nautilia profundicola (strain ATCC BAA-1463 / DSM 18972 / AmH) TaxID=598659 RepID=B9L6L3_NAUPA|nr:type I methionyl aminopeptidase [Nautilia profundicola]ACM93544.1 methionine aminopeptidase, type I [Nautilia profundicola AmH]